MNNALINETEDKQTRLCMLLKSLRCRIENSILRESRVVIAIENICSCCRNCCQIDEFEIENDYIMISNENCEMYFKLNDLTECNFDEDNLVFDCKTNDECLHMEFL